MSKEFAELDDDLRGFIARQHMFFVATAPSGGDGHLNLSPKGLDTFRSWAETVAYLDLTGSRVETIAHCRTTADSSSCSAFDGRRASSGSTAGGG